VAAAEHQAELRAAPLVRALAPADRHPVATVPALEWYQDSPDRREPAVDQFFP